MTENELALYLGKKVRVICTDGDVVEGFCDILTRAVDNEPEVAEISLKPEDYKNGLIAIPLPEIEKIEIVQ